jgi:signal transduction histidine kinase
MANLSLWLDSHTQPLIQAVADELSQDETQKTQVLAIISDFFTQLKRTVAENDKRPLFDYLKQWVDERSTLVEGDLAGMVPVLTTIKRVTSSEIRRTASQAEVIDLLITSDEIYTDAIAHLSRLESNALHADMRQKLEEAQIQLERLDKSKSDFINVAAHELRTPITLVEGYCDMMRSVMKNAEDDPMSGMLLEGIDGGVKRLREIIRDMLDVSLISLDMLEIHRQPTWLHQVVDALERTMKPALSERELTLTVNYDSIPRQPIFADPERLLQVLQKTVYNAIKYTPDGGMIRIQGRELTRFIDLTIEDNGIGIATDDLSRIFEMFTTVGDISLHSSGKTKFRGGGPGLGLYISKGIMEAHEGNIWVESDGYDPLTCPGSTFHIMIPMHDTTSDDNIMSMFSDIK